MGTPPEASEGARLGDFFLGGRGGSAVNGGTMVGKLGVDGGCCNGGGRGDDCGGKEVETETEAAAALRFSIFLCLFVVFGAFGNLSSRGMVDAVAAAAAALRVFAFFLGFLLFWIDDAVPVMPRSVTTELEPGSCPGSALVEMPPVD